AAMVSEMGECELAQGPGIGHPASRSPITNHAHMSTTILRLSCPDRVGLLARISSFVAEHGGNLLEVNQFTDPFANWFFARLAIETGTLRLSFPELRTAFTPLA